MALPDGIYDRLADARLLEELKGLIESGQVTLDRVLAGERPARLAAVISKLVAEALDEMEVEGVRRYSRACAALGYVGVARYAASRVSK